jgi:hypothetical protein
MLALIPFECVPLDYNAVTRAVKAWAILVRMRGSGEGLLLNARIQRPTARTC